jgi:hypothetical protein
MLVELVLLPHARTLLFSACEIAVRQQQSVLWAHASPVEVLYCVLSMFVGSALLIYNMH